MAEPNGTPWWARLGERVLTSQGLATLIAVMLVVFLMWGAYRVITDVRDVGATQVAQQERIITRLDEALVHLQRIEALLARGTGAGFAEISGELERVNARLGELERKAATP
jgi:hypothetical protein